MLQNQQFSAILLKWNKQQNVRSMPWKGIKDPYKIWLSEVILQQTRVDQGEKYYRTLTENYPSVKELAEADEQIVYRFWQGLGYYNRCRNMLFTARYIQNELGGEFPREYEGIKALKGVGDYTAAAIASFAFDLPYAVVDGNVVRVLSRVFGLDISFHSTAGKKSFQEFAQSLLPHSKAAIYNQSIMDLGATICMPKQPLCAQCPFETHCQAKFLNRIDDFPVKKQRIALKVRYMHFLVFEDKQHLYITKRTEKDIWHNLYTFFMLESDSENVDLGPYSSIGKVEGEPQYADQTLTHQKIKGYFHRIKLFNPKELNKLKLQKVKKKDISAFAFPRILISFFQKNNYL